jgi:hypothetical protein
MQETKMILASKIVSNPEIVDEIIGKYQIIYDQALARFKFDNLNKAICIMAEKGWRCVNITSFNLSGGPFSTATHMYALMEKL